MKNVQKNPVKSRKNPTKNGKPPKTPLKPIKSKKIQVGWLIYLKTPGFFNPEYMNTLKEIILSNINKRNIQQKKNKNITIEAY